MYNLTTGALLAQAAHDIDTDGPFDTVKMALFTNDIQPTRSRVLGDFVITDFGGLTNLKAIVWGAAFLNDNNQAEVLAAMLTWLTTATTLLPVTAYGIVITNTAGNVLLLAERFAVPIVFARSGQAESVVPRLVWDT